MSVEAIARNVGRLQTLVEDMLLLTKVNDPRRPFLPTQVDLGALDRGDPRPADDPGRARRADARRVRTYAAACSSRASATTWPDCSPTSSATPSSTPPPADASRWRSTRRTADGVEPGRRGLHLHRHRHRDRRGRPGDALRRVRPLLQPRRPHGARAPGSGWRSSGASSTGTAGRSASSRRRVRAARSGSACPCGAAGGDRTALDRADRPVAAARAGGGGSHGREPQADAVAARRARPARGRGSSSSWSSASSMLVAGDQEASPRSRSSATSSAALADPPARHAVGAGGADALGHRGARPDHARRPVPRPPAAAGLDRRWLSRRRRRLDKERPRPGPGGGLRGVRDLRPRPQLGAAVDQGRRGAGALRALRRWPRSSTSPRRSGSPRPFRGRDEVAWAAVGVELVGVLAVGTVSVRAPGVVPGRDGVVGVRPGLRLPARGAAAARDRLAQSSPWS